jgi:uncharacterized protein (DUF433 family)
MEYPASPYVYWTGQGLRITGARVSLDTIVIYHTFHRQTPEQIAEGFSTVPLSHIYGALAYYYEHEELMKEYLAEGDRKFEEIRLSPYFNHELHAKLEAAWQRLDEKKTA